MPQDATNWLSESAMRAGETEWKGREGTPVTEVPWDSIRAGVMSRVGASDGQSYGNPRAVGGWRKTSREERAAAYLDRLQGSLRDRDGGLRRGESWGSGVSVERLEIWNSVIEVLVDSQRTQLLTIEQVRHVLQRMAFEAALTGQQMAEWAFRDIVAGCANRLATTRELHRLLREQTPFLVLYGDLDGFKHINDTWGHSAGDHVLKVVAQRWQGLMRPGDWLGRWGGDEFLLIVSAPLSPDRVAGVIERFGSTVQGPVSLPSNETMTVSASFGWATYPDDGITVDKILNLADQRLYEAKRHQPSAGAKPDVRGTAFFYDTANAPQPVTALNLHGVEVYYQPILSLETPRVQRWEGLMRYRRGDGVLQPAGDVLSTVPRAQLPELDQAVLRQAYEDLLRWEEQGQVITISVNVDPESLLAPAWYQELEALGRAYPSINPVRIMVEVRENTQPLDTRGTLEALWALKRAGHPVALDNFGSGASPLLALSRLPISMVKIDPAITRRWQSDDGRVLIQSVVGLRRPMGFRVVAQGLETREQHEALRSWGCDAGQGWWQSPALPAQAVLSWAPQP